LSNVKHVIFYIHAWHHTQNIAPIIHELDRQNVGYNIITFIAKDDNYPRVEQLFPGKKVEVFAESRAFQIGEKLRSTGRLGQAVWLIGALLWLTTYFGLKRPSRLVVSEDVTLWSGLCARAARFWRIKCVHLPAENVHFVEGWLYERAREGQIVREGWLSKLTQRLYPVNVQTYQGKLLYWYSSLRVLASYPLGLLPLTPWVRGANHMDAVAVNSQVQFEENTRYGLDAAQQTVTGFPMHDQLVECLRQRELIKTQILGELGLPTDKKVCLIIGTAPRFVWAEAELPGAYAAHRDLLRALHDRLGEDYAILVKVHPREDRDTFIKRIGDSECASFIKTEFSVYQLLAVSDIVLMFLSSTVIASLALDIPIIAYGIYKLAGMEDFYKQYPSVDLAYSLDEINAVLDKIDDPDYIASVRSRRAADREKYGIFDGKNTERVVELILR
jgi:hypothetical protein